LEEEGEEGEGEEEEGGVLGVEHCYYLKEREDLSYYCGGEGGNGEGGNWGWEKMDVGEGNKKGLGFDDLLR
jgi:hypothetical protein